MKQIHERIKEILKDVPLYVKSDYKDYDRAAVRIAMVMCEREVNLVLKEYSQVNESHVSVVVDLFKEQYPPAWVTAFVFSKINNVPVAILPEAPFKMYVTEGFLEEWERAVNDPLQRIGGLLPADALLNMGSHPNAVDEFLKSPAAIQTLSAHSPLVQIAHANPSINAAVKIIYDERFRQVNEEGHTELNDDRYVMEQLAMAAACYAAPNGVRRVMDGYSKLLHADQPPSLWPWAKQWWKPTPTNRLRELAKAGALLIAEIERLLRMGVNKTTTDENRQ